MRRSLLRVALPSALLLLAFAAVQACTELKTAPGRGDAGGEEPGVDEDGDGIPDGDAGKDGGKKKADGGSGGPTATGPGGQCRPFVLPCLDKDLPNVIEVPTEGNLATAFANAKANDVVQIKGALTVPAGWRIEPYVTFRGCEGAKIGGAIGFKGGAGIVEGFEIVAAGSVVANQTGSYIVRQNRVTAWSNTDGGAPIYEAGVSGRAVDGLVGADVTLLVENNVFVDRLVGLEAATSYNTYTRKVKLTAQNNVFWNVDEPIHVYRSGAVGVIDATIDFNTFHGFSKAITFVGIPAGFPVPTSGNLFSTGTTAVSGGPFSVAHSLVWDVTTPSTVAPFAGAFGNGDPAFVDADAGDLRLGAGSAAVDLVPEGTAVPSPDHGGCPRPGDVAGLPARADVGAFETQPL